MEILSIVGARPQFIKVAAVARAAKNMPNVNHSILHTGQHYDHNMSQAFFDDLDIPKPDVHFEVEARSNEEMTSEMERMIRAKLKEIRPDVLMVYGDTNSTLAGARAAHALGVKLAHVEAGLRSFNLEMPEEYNRIETDKISDFLFCPTQKAVDNLESEGFRNGACQIDMVGDVMYDAVKYYASKKRLPIEFRPSEKPIILTTIHRASNTDDSERLSAIIDSLNALTEEYQIVFPMHPRTLKSVQGLDMPILFDRLEPQSYLEILALIDEAVFVMTDSGGLQKEAFFMQTPCLTMRNETEWTELVELGYNQLVEPQIERIKSSIEIFRRQGVLDYGRPLYGDGKASEKILESLLRAI